MRAQRTGLRRIGWDPARTIDDVVFLRARGPASYTGEDTLELSSHGNPLIAAELQRLFRSLGFRDALPGEFTQRAFLNGKLDLTRAEAIHELIRAETSAGVALARASGEGKLAGLVSRLRADLIAALGYLEAHIDFAEEEVGSYDATALLPPLEGVRSRLRALAATYAYGIKLREGVRVALCGRPNAGKSSLFNALLQRDRAIVTEIPGTTRDVLEDRVVLEGADFVLSDTAGLRSSEDVVERLGIERSLRAAAAADLILVVIDASALPPRADAETWIEAEIAAARDALGGTEQSAPMLVTLNKADLWDHASRAAIDAALGSKGACHAGQPCRLVRSSASDTAQLRAALSEHALSWNSAAAGMDAVLLSQRQKDLVDAAIAGTDAAISLLAAGGYPEAAASELNAVRRQLQEIVGEIYVDDVLGHVFSSFCIGK